MGEFLDRYGKDSRDFRKPIPSYLRMKRIKGANTVEIQFYVEQLRLKWGKQFSTAEEARFRKQAKEELFAQWSVTLNPYRKGLYEFAHQFSLGSLEEKASQRYVSRKHSVELPPAFEDLARELFEIIQDKPYWKYKTYWRLGTADAISRMQETLERMPYASLEAKMNAVRNIAWAQHGKKNFFYLWFTLEVETRDPMVKACYALFREDLRTSTSLQRLKANWQDFKNNEAKAQRGHCSIPLVSLSRSSGE